VVITIDRLVLDGSRPLPKGPDSPSPTQSFPRGKTRISTNETSLFGRLSSLVSTADHRITSLVFVAGLSTISGSNVMSSEDRGACYYYLTTWPS
jgi:hypothetical protein